jgi:hypothetical protein
MSGAISEGFLCLPLRGGEKPKFDRISLGLEIFDFGESLIFERDFQTSGFGDPQFICMIL